MYCYAFVYFRFSIQKYIHSILRFLSLPKWFRCTGNQTWANVLSAVMSPRCIKKLRRSLMVRAQVDQTNTGRPAAKRSSTEVCGAVLRPSSLSEGGPDHDDNLLAEARDPFVKQPNILPRPATKDVRGVKEESNIITDVNLHIFNLINHKLFC